MELQELKCPKCEYEKHLLIGTQDLDQTFSDLNEDFAYYKVFLCPEGKEIHSIDVHDREFDGNCPEHKVKLEPLPDLPENCPKCEATVHVTKKNILKTEGGG